MFDYRSVVGRLYPASFWVSGYFQVQTAVSFRECTRFQDILGRGIRPIFQGAKLACLLLVSGFRVSFWSLKNSLGSKKHEKTGDFCGLDWSNGWDFLGAAKNRPKAATGNHCETPRGFHEGVNTLFFFWGGKGVPDSKGESWRILGNNYTF